MNKFIHIVCPEIPHPSSTADMADTYFQLQLLQQAGYSVLLHCFYNDAEPDAGHLQDITASVHLYPRNQGHKGVSIRHPYCISSRSNPQLLENLLAQVCPVIFQGMTTTFYLPELAAQGYKTIVRINGIASARYESFTKCEKSLLKKAYSFNEARLIRKWEEKIAERATVITTSVSDQEKFLELYQDARTACIAPFMRRPEISVQPGTGMYCLYYGDMSNPENERMVHWLSEQVFSKMPVPFIIADTCTAARTQDANHHPESNICTICNPDETALDELIRKAQVVILPRGHKHGFDKRLVRAIEKGRHCICNTLMIEDSGLENFFIIANGGEAMIDAINHYFSCAFTDKEIEKRKGLLSDCHFPRQCVDKLVAIIDG